jgi:hypothetical protein
MNGGIGSIRFRGINLELEYESDAFVPAIWTLSNGDP